MKSKKQITKIETKHKMTIIKTIQSIFSFLLLFCSLLMLVIHCNNLIEYVIPNNSLLSITILYFTLILFIEKEKQCEYLWLFLAIMHGIAHIIDPPFHKTEININYSPLFDYIIHGIQCLTVFHSFPKTPIHFITLCGIYFSISSMVAGAIAHLEPDFLTHYLWIPMSMAGVFGTNFHMMLLIDETDDSLSENKKNIIKYSNYIVWITPYIGYILVKNIPEYDYLMNKIGLFKLWYMVCFITIKIVKSPHYKEILTDKELV